MANDLVVQEFVKAIKEEPTDTNRTYNATVSRIDNEGVVWVNIHGSDKETPTASTSTEVKRGDAVTVNWRNNKLYIGGNYSNPSAGTNTVMPSVEYIAGLVEKNISVESINSTTAYIGDLTSSNITAGNIVADHATVNSLDVDSMSAATAYIDDLTSGNVTAQNIIADHGTIGSLDSNYAHITNGVIDNATIDYADIDNLDAHYAEIDLANVNNAWIQNGTIKDAAISNEMVNSISANKLTAGTIDASNITVTNLNASNITAGSISVDGITIDVANNEATIDGAYIEDGTITLNGLAQEVTDKIDGAIESFTGTTVPTLNNYPASSWTTNEIKATHVGDVYYVVNSQSEQNGYAYRFSYINSAYSWQLIKDSDVTAALARITTAEGEIDGLQTFESETSSWITETDDEISSIMSRTTTLEANVETARTYYAECSTAAATAAKVATISPAISDFTLRSGTTVIVNFASTNTNSSATFNLNSTGAIAIRYKGSALTSTTRAYLAAGRLVVLVYDGTYWEITGATTDANTYDRTAYKASLTATAAISAGRVGVLDADGHIMQLSTTPFDIAGPILYIGTAYTATALTQTNNYTMYGTPFSLANTKSGFTGTAGKPVYIVGTLNGHMFTPDAAIFTTTVPTEVDNKHYILFGLMSTTTNATLNAEHPIFTYGANGFAGLDSNNQAAVSTKVETSVFNTLSQTVDTNTANITSLSSVVDTKADGSTVSTLSNTVNEVQQTTNSNSSKISNITTTLGTNADGTTKTGDIVHRTSAVEQDLSGFKTTVSQTYQTKSDMSNYSTTTQMNSAIEQSASSITSSVAQTYATKTELGDKADADDLEALDSRVETAETNITQTATSIESLASNTSTYTKPDGTTGTNSMASAISQNASDITLKVSKNDVINQINVSTEGITIDADKVNITGATIFTSGRLSETSLNNTYAGVDDIPENVSDLNNDTGFITSASVPTKTSQLTNDSDYTTATAVANTYATQTALNTEINQRKATYGTCSTTASTQAKEVTCADFELVAGNEITVKFSTANTYASGAVQLNVNGKGAKNVWVANAVTSASNQLLWGTGAYITFRYDGTQFIVIGEPRSWYGASTTAAATAAKTDTTAITGAVICKGAKIELAMTYGNTNTSATLNIQSTGAKAIYYGNTTTRPTSDNGHAWIAATTATFTFDGAYYRLQGQTVINGDNITTGTVSANRLNIADTITAINNDSTTTINGGKITTGTLSASAVDASSGTFNTANIPNLNASKITAGDIAADRMKTNSITAINSLTTGKINAERLDVGSITVGSLSDGANYSTTTQMNNAISTAVGSIEDELGNIYQLNILTSYTSSSVVHTAQLLQNGVDISSQTPNDFEWNAKLTSGYSFIGNGRSITLSQSNLHYAHAVTVSWTRRQYTYLLNNSGNNLVTSTGAQLMGRTEY